MRSLIIAMALLSVPGAQAREVSVSLFGIFKPQRVSIESTTSLPLAVTAVAADGRRRVFVTNTIDARCTASALPCARLAKKRVCSARFEVRTAAGHGRDGLRAGVVGGPLRVYDGWLEVRPASGVCLLLNHVPLEDYVQSVACHEMRPGGPEALRAQAVASRSYALSVTGKHPGAGCDFCDLTHCQVYTGRDACTSKQRRALAAARGLVLLFDGSPARTYYFSTCAGSTTSAADVWGPVTARPYLLGVEDGRPPYCSDSAHMHWTFRIGRAGLCRRLGKQFPALGRAGKLEKCKLAIEKVGRHGWVGRVSISSASGPAIDLRGERFHMLMGKWFGWGRFKSARFELEKRGQEFLFHGRGLGHGVGMCQYGAMGMERAGADFKKILEHYYPGTQLGRWP